MQGHHILIPDLISDVPSVVGVVGADDVGTVNLRHAVDGIVNVGLRLLDPRCTPLPADKDDMSLSITIYKILCSPYKVSSVTKGFRLTYHLPPVTEDFNYPSPIRFFIC